LYELELANHIMLKLHHNLNNDDNNNNNNNNADLEPNIGTTAKM